MKTRIISRLRLFSATLALACMACMALQAQNLPDIKVQDASGKAVSVRSLMQEGKPVVLTFWSTTCKPCMKELDTLTEVYEEWNEEVPFVICAVSTDDTRSLARAKALPSGKGWDAFPFLYDVNQDLGRALNIASIPYAVVFSPDGKLHYSHVGYMPGDEEELFEAIKDSLRPDKAAKKPSRR